MSRAVNLKPLNELTADRYVVVDLEATCWDDDSVPSNESEIIEIGAVLHDGALRQPKGWFARPVIHTRLSDFCRGLTSITQEQIDNARLLSQVLPDFLTWATHKGPVQFLSWGFYDNNMLTRAVRRSPVQRLPLSDEASAEFRAMNQLRFPPADFIPPHLNLKKLFAEVYGLKGRPGRAPGIGLGKALDHLSLSFKGTQHRGVDDAVNITRILDHLLKLKRS